MSWRKGVGALVLAGALAVPVGVVLAHGHSPVTHPSGPPTSVPPVSFSTSAAPSGAGGPPSGVPSHSNHAHGKGAALQATIHSNQSLQRSIILMRMQILATLKQIRMVIRQDEQSGNTTAVTTAEQSLTTLLQNARTALQDQHKADTYGSQIAASSSSSSSSSPSVAGASGALSAINTWRTAELQTMTTLETSLQQLLTTLQSTASSSSS